MRDPTLPTLPSGADSILAAAGADLPSLWLVVDTDISLDGQFESQWLAVDDDALWLLAHDNTAPPTALADAKAARDHTEGGIATIESNTLATSRSGAARRSDRLRVVKSIPWVEIDDVRITTGVGSGSLQVRVGQDWHDLLRFSNALSHRFHKVSRHLDRFAQGELDAAQMTAQLLEAEPLDPPKCPTCGLRFSHRNDSCPRCLQRGQILQRLWSLLKPHWRGGLTLCVLTILGVMAELVPPKLQQYMVDHLLTGKANNDIDVRTALLVVVLALAFSRIMLSIVAVVKGRVASVIGAGLTCSLRLQMVEKLQKLAVNYYDRHQVGSMISRVAHDSEVLRGLMHQLTGGFLLQIVQLVGVGAMLLWLNFKLAVFTLIPVPLVFLGSWFFWRKVYPRYYRLWDASSKQMAALNGMLSGIRIVKSFAQENREYQRFQSAAEHLRDWRLWVEYASVRYSAVMQIVFSLGGLIVWFVGGRDVIGNEMTLGELIAFLAYLSMFYAPLGAISNFTTWLTSFLSGSKRVLELLDTPLDVTEPEHPRPWNNVQGRIEFDNVTFGYERHEPVLKNVSFEVEPGEMIGIVGRSGSGKTTLVNLLGRFYDVHEGAIRVDGIDVRDLSTHDLRERLGIVFQDSFLFRGTVWSNLSYGRPQTEIEAGLIAAKASGAHDFICRKQLGYETQLGERGSGLSGGEKQRLSIARTLLYDPTILVLDEATSNIDAEAEKSIQEALDVLVKGRTTVAIAHRLSTLRNADRILVFDRGRLVESGSHAELIDLQGVYARLVKIQTQVSKDPNVDKLLFHADEPSEAMEVRATRNQREEKRTSSARASRNPTSRNPTGTSDHDDADSGSTVATLPPPNEFRATDDAKHPNAYAKQLDWLTPRDTSFHLDEHQIVMRRGHEIKTIHHVFIVCAFPATRPDEYLSVRYWDEDGDDVELGMIRDIRDWPEATRTLLRRAIDRRYLLRRVTGIHAIKLAFGFLECDVQTSLGRAQFTMRWTQSKAVPFGDNGKLLIDTNDNRYVVPDISELPPREAELFEQYVYW